MQRPEISWSFILPQTCRNCQLSVTCGPVYVAHDLGVLCGRCRELVKGEYRNYSYEALASLFLYPCKNWQNHCPVKLLWNESLQHEERCGYTGCCSLLCGHPGAFFKGKLNVPKDSPRLILIPDEILDYISCVLCEGYLNCEPVYIEPNGRNICHRCINSNGTPPNCRRNYAYESISKMFVFPCSFRNKGCPEQLIFGRALWQHEAECSYGQFLVKKAEPTQNNSTNGNQKQKGVIRTAHGHIFATLTPNALLFAPPEVSKIDVKGDLLKSLAKTRQGKQRRRAEELQNQWGRRNSDDESISTNGSGIKNTASHSGSSTPDYLNGNISTRPYGLQEDYRRDETSGRMVSPDGRSSNQGSIRNSIKQNYNDLRYQNFPNEPERVYRGEVAIQEQYRSSIRPSFREQRYPNPQIDPERQMYPNEGNDYYRDSLRQYAGDPRYQPNYDSELASHFPVMMPHQLNDGFGSTGRRVSNRESFNGNRLLINELKLKQDFIKRTHSIRGESEASPNNLEYNRQATGYLR